MYVLDAVDGQIMQEEASTWLSRSLNGACRMDLDKLLDILWRTTKPTRYDIPMSYFRRPDRFLGPPDVRSQASWRVEKEEKELQHQGSRSDRSALRQKQNLLRTTFRDSHWVLPRTPGVARGGPRSLDQPLFIPKARKSHCTKYDFPGHFADRLLLCRNCAYGQSSFRAIRAT